MNCGVTKSEMSAFLDTFLFFHYFENNKIYFIAYFVLILVIINKGDGFKI